MVAILVQAVYARTSVCSCLFSLVILPSSSSTTVVGAKVGPVIMVYAAVGTVVGPEVGPEPEVGPGPEVGPEVGPGSIIVGMTSAVEALL